MKAKHLRVMPVFASLFLLAACESLPPISFGKPMGGDFKPLSSEVAAIAAPGASADTPPLNCVVGKGAAHMSRGWVDFGTTSFTLPPGGRVNVPLKAGGGTFTIQGFFDADGQKLIFCPVVDAPPDERIACSSIYALGDDLAMGIKRTFDVPDAVRGGAISCAFDKENLKKL